MNFLKTAEISGAAMLAQKTRLEVAATNIANMHSTGRTEGSQYRPMTVTLRPATSFGTEWTQTTQGLASVQARVEPQTRVVARSVYEPGHPDADVNGMVRYPGIDHVQEMMTVTQALRAYEANLSVLQAAKTMAQKALEIGAQ